MRLDDTQNIDKKLNGERNIAGNIPDERERVRHVCLGLTLLLK
jgi:hypothetical protein